MKIDAIFLVEALCHETSLVLINDTIRFKLSFVSPTTFEDRLIRWRENKGPTSLLLESRKLLRRG